MKQCIFVASLCVFGASSALANGFGEERPYAFRSPSEKNVLFNGENIRLNFKTQDKGVGSSQGLGTQTGNSLSITIEGDGDNVINTGQDNSGDQTVQDASDSGTVENGAGDLQILN